MQKIRNLLLLTGLSLSAWFASPSIAVASCGARDLECLRRSFRASITPSQRTYLTSLRLRYMRSLMLLRAQLRLARVELSYHLTAPEVDAQLLDAKIRAVGDIQADILRKRSEYHLRIRSSLSSTQASWMDQITLLRTMYPKEKLKEFSKRYERRRLTERSAPPALVAPPADAAPGEAPVSKSEPPSLGPSSPSPIAVVGQGEIAPDHPKDTATSKPSQPTTQPIAPMEPQEEEEGEEEEGEEEKGGEKGAAPGAKKQPPTTQPSNEDEEEEEGEEEKGAAPGVKKQPPTTQPSKEDEEDEQDEEAVLKSQGKEQKKPQPPQEQGQEEEEAEEPAPAAPGTKAPPPAEPSSKTPLATPASVKPAAKATSPASAKPTAKAPSKEAPPAPAKPTPKK